MDGTLIVENSWDLLYRGLGLGESPWLAEYASGKISYRKLFELDLNHWIKEKGPINRAFVGKTAETVTIAPGSKELFSVLREHGIRTVIVTAGLKEFAERVVRELGADEAYYNELLYDSDNLCKGKFIDRVDPLRKWEIVEHVLRKFNVAKEESFSVGDTHYDESMFRATGSAFILDGPDGAGVSGAVKIKNLKEILNYVIEK